MDIRRLELKQIVKCGCGESSGVYVDELHAEISGFAVPLGISNGSFVEALSLRNFNKSKNGRSRGVSFDAFVIPDDSETVKFVDKL
jgi:hypothetical protein